MRPGACWFDGHLDLAYNALAYGRDQTLPVAALRARELGEPERDEPGVATNSLDAMRRAGVGFALATVIARCRPTDGQGVPTRYDLDWPHASMAHAVARGQLAYYEWLARAGWVELVKDAASLGRLRARWEARVLGAPPPPVGLVLTMEGADPLVTPGDLAGWYELGLRTLMLAHVGPGRYAQGTVRPPYEDGPLTAMGRELLVEMGRLGMALDLTHVSDLGFFEALDRFGGPVYASHSNCRSLAPGTRQLSDAQLRRLIERGGVVGVALHIGMLARGPDGAAPRRSEVGLDTVARHIDHVCQLAGDARHAALGTDLDGGFGAALCPHDFDGPADLARVGEALRGKGYTDADVEAVLGGNWLAFFERHLPGG